MIFHVEVDDPAVLRDFDRPDDIDGYKKWTDARNAESPCVVNFQTLQNSLKVIIFIWISLSFP